MHQQQTAFENIVRIGEIARNEQFLFFPQCFQLNQKTVSPFVHIFYIISLFSVELEKPKIGISVKGCKSHEQPKPNAKFKMHLTHYHTRPHFDALKII